jgi:hypothetical protein
MRILNVCTYEIDNMKKLLLTLTFATFSTNVLAEIFQVDTNDKEVAYALLDTIKKSGNIIFMWSLYDLKDTKYLAKKAYQSTKFHIEYRCDNEKIRIRGMQYFSGKMGQGDIIYKEAFTDIWTSMAGVESEWRYACYSAR